MATKKRRVVKKVSGSRRETGARKVGSSGKDQKVKVKVTKEKS